MAKNENSSFTFSQPVTINASTNHNATGAIIGNAPIAIIQHFDKSQPAPSTPDMQTYDAAVVDSETETASLAELLDYAETFMGSPLSENTIRNVLERANVESCGKEIRGRARAKLFPKTQAEKAIADYVFASKKR